MSACERARAYTPCERTQPSYVNCNMIIDVNVIDVIVILISRVFGLKNRSIVYKCTQ